MESLNMLMLTSGHWLYNFKVKSKGRCFGPVTIEQFENAKRCQHFNVKVLPENQPLVDWIKETNFLRCPPNFLVVSESYESITFRGIAYIMHDYNKRTYDFLKKNKAFYLWSEK